VEYGAGILTGLVDGVFVAFRDPASGAIQTMKSVIDLCSAARDSRGARARRGSRRKHVT